MPRSFCLNGQNLYELINIAENFYRVYIDSVEYMLERINTNY